MTDDSIPSEAGSSLAGLREVDDRVLHFLPGGLGVDLVMREEDSASYWAEVAANCKLDPSVAEWTRRSFDGLRKVFTYGILCYDIFTLVHDQALLLLEQALRDRFLEFYGDEVPYELDGVQYALPVRGWDDVAKHFRRLRKGATAPRLIITEHGQPATMTFNGMLFGLRQWARRSGLLGGQRNRHREKLLSDMRNGIAHPSGYHLFDPTHTARTLYDLAEIINGLWGQTTPGGRLYPAPLVRHPVALAWNPRSGATSYMSADVLLGEDREWDCYTHFAVIQAVVAGGVTRADTRLDQFDSLYETTVYPADCLWGPGSRDDAVAWLRTRDLEADTCTYLDRYFAVRVTDDEVFAPMRPSVAAALDSDDQVGRWHLVKADFPEDALGHVRQVASGSAECTTTGPCPHCDAETAAIGTFASVLLGSGSTSSPSPAYAPDFFVSSFQRWPRSFPR